MYWRSFELKRTWFEVDKCNSTHFHDIKVIWVEEDLIWGCWVQLYTFESIKVIWIEEDLNWIIWGCENILEFKRTRFRWFKDTMAYLNWKGLIYSDLRLERHMRFKGPIAHQSWRGPDLKVQRYIWKEKYSFKFKKT